jgi:hypothetical protein
MTMPDVSSAMHLASVDYMCTFAPLGNGPVTFSALDPVHFLFNFETGETQVSPGVIQITTDYSWFVQATVEADITTAMQTISAAIATLLGEPLAAVQAAGQVQRVWTFRPTIQGGGWSAGAVTTTDVYAWLPPPGP